jgi:CubicO group peptidase (beta-lactamase class C family)
MKRLRRRAPGTSPTVAPAPSISRRAALQTALGAGVALVAARAGRAVPVAGQSAIPDGFVPALDQFIRGALQTYGVPGAAVAVVSEGQTIFLRGYGVRRLGESAPVDESTVFQLASNTKPFTAAALGTLVDEKRLDWDTPIISYLPGFALADPYPTTWATPRDMLAMRSGLPAFTGDLLGDAGYSRDHVLHQVRLLTPGASFREQAYYSNISYFIAGQVGARAAGLSLETGWEELVRSRLLEPLGMHRSGVSSTDVPADGNWASNHVEVNGMVEPYPWVQGDVLGAAQSVVSTAADMARWMTMLLDAGQFEGRRLLNADTITEMFTPSMVAEVSFSEMPPIYADSGFAYGLGWGTYYFNDFQVMEKGGALDGVRTVVELVPAKRLGIVVLANLNLLPFPEAVRGFVLERFLGPAPTDIQAEIRARTAQLEQLLAASPPPANPLPPSIPLADYAGDYASALYGRVAVRADGDGLRLTFGPAGYAGALAHYSRDTFLLTFARPDEGSQQATFTIGPTGQPTAFDTETLGRFRRT